MTIQRAQPMCPKCGARVSVWRRVCFGVNPRIEYHCLAYLCGWEGTEPTWATE